jgi:AraC-like DNA-binding protein
MNGKSPARRGETTHQSPEIRIWQLGDLCETVHGPIAGPVAKFLHQGFTIGLVEAGAIEAAYRGRLQRLERGELIIVPPEQVIGLDPIKSAIDPMRICVHCPTEVFQKVANEIAGLRKATHIFSECVTSDPYLSTLVRKFQRSLALPASLLERSSHFHEMLTGAIRHCAALRPQSRKFRPEPTLVRRVRDYLDEHCAQNVTLDELARTANLSAFQLNRAFRKEIGLPPHAYQTQARVKRGKALLAQGMPIARVAIEVGFFDQSHFTYQFKRLLSFTPGTYQKNAPFLASSQSCAMPSTTEFELHLPTPMAPLTRSIGIRLGKNTMT